MNQLLLLSLLLSMPFARLEAKSSKRQVIPTITKRNKIATIKILSNKGGRDTPNKMLPLLLVQPRSTYSQKEVDMSAKQIEEIYKGIYSCASVEVKPLSKLEDGVVHLVFQVTIKDIEISKIIINGTQISSKKISSLIRRRPSPTFFPYIQKPTIDLSQLSSSAQAIENYAKSIGYFDFKVESINAERVEGAGPNRLSIVINTNEGEQYKIGSVSVENECTTIDLARFVGLINQGESYNKQRIEYVLFKIRAALQRQNLNNYDVNIDEVKSGKGLVSLKISIRQIKDPVIIDSIEITGNFSISDRVIRQKLNISVGDPASEAAIQMQQAMLMKTGLFKNVVMKTQMVDKDRVAVVIEVDEMPTNFTLSGGMANEDVGAEASVKIPNALDSGDCVSVMGYLSRNPKIETSISNNNVFGLGIDLILDFGIYRHLNDVCMFGYPETAAEFLQYLFTDWHSDVKKFISNVKPYLEQNANAPVFNIPRNVLSNWKENYFIQGVEDSIRLKLSMSIPGENAFVLSLFGNVRRMERRYDQIPFYFESEVLENGDSVKKAGGYEKLMSILGKDVENEEQSSRLFKDMLITQKNEIGTIGRYIFSNNSGDFSYSYGSEVTALTGTTSALRFKAFAHGSQSLGEYGAIDFEASTGIAFCQSSLDNFTSEVYGLRYGPIETYRFTFLGGRKLLKLATYGAFPVFSMDSLSIVLKPGISFNSIWDSGLTPNRLPESLCNKRGWSKNSLDIAANDFSVIPIASGAIMMKFDSLILPNLGNMWISVGINRPITSSPFVRYSPIDISFGFSNN